MLIFKKIQPLQQHLSSITNNQFIGFVPTMGALHKGHLSLIKEAKKENQTVVASIFVNPTQFNNTSDLKNYPRTIDTDIELLKSEGCDIVFIPTIDEMYDHIKSEHFDFDGLDNVMEGRFRERHFDGVGTIVKRFFEIIKPHNAYFGEKDFQQLQIIKKIVSKLGLTIKIIGCEILREDDGLAMSSRNTLLTEEQRKNASFIYKTLKEAKLQFKNHSPHNIINWVKDQFENHPFFKLEYFQIVDEKTLLDIKEKDNTKKFRAFIAVFANNVRLIDNIEL